VTRPPLLPDRRALAAWVAEGALVGALTLFGGVGGLGLAATLLGNGAPKNEFYTALGLSPVVGGVGGALLALAVAAPLAAAWARAPRLAFVAGPAVGGVGAVSTSVALAWVTDGHGWPGGWVLASVATVGVATIGPPWVGALALRAAGRSSLLLALATGPWGAAVAFLAMGALIAWHR
jgi:hypothetical protein